jgi:2-polyprenyl-3-methyl-5-hydroxy-6-metoxy-1,4-benzoquinol methylase
MAASKTRKSNLETRQAWDANANFWDERMREGNDFFNILEWPAIERLLAVQPGQHILDIACGNGLTSRRLAASGARVTAFDFSKKLIGIARSKPNPGSRIGYHVIDATDETALLKLGQGAFDAALCNMGLFDMADIVPLFRSLGRLLKTGCAFIFSLTHPAFNNSSCVQVVEQMDDQGTLKTISSVKISRYLTPFQSRGAAISGQPVPQWYFDRPLQYYFNLGFENGFILDGFEECGFPPGHSVGRLLKSGGDFCELPQVLVARLRSVRP